MVIGEIFKKFLKKLDFLLPKLEVPKKEDRSGDPTYYPYNYKVFHTIEDYITFKN